MNSNGEPETAEGTPEALAEALRDTAFSFEPPPYERFHARAVQRSSQIKRRRATLGGALACLLVLATAGAVSAALTGHTPRDATTADTPAATAPQPPASASADLGSVTEQKVLQAFERMLPAGARIQQSKNPGRGSTSLWADGPLVNALTGNWYVAAGTSLEGASSAGFSTVSVAAQNGVQTATCAEASARNPGSCTVGHTRGGTLILDKTPHRPDPIWDYSWLSPAGHEVDLSIGGVSPSDFALTEQQVIVILTDPAWDRITAELPAPVCVGGQLTQVTPPAASTTPKLELECSLDAKTYPMD